MQTKVKYKAVDLRGNVVTKVVKVEHPEFNEVNDTVTLKVNGKLETIPVPKTVDEQVIDWLDKQDKSDLMYDNDWHCILNYDVHYPKPKVDKRQLVFDLAEKLFTSDDLRASFVLTYARLYRSIKSLKVEDQVKAVTDALGLAYESQSYAYKRVSAILRGEDPEQVTQIGSEDVESVKKLQNG
jgi:hypothetical protein